MGLLYGSGRETAYEITTGLIIGLVGPIGGYLASSATTIQAVRGTVYTEPGSAQQMRLISSSANDTSAGTGARTVKITYYDGSLTGPFTETVTMNGTTAVSTVGTNLRFIERVEVVTVGTNGTNAGTISLQAIGGGTTFATIAASDGRTFFAHHYIAVNRTCYVRSLIAASSAVAGGCFLRKIASLTANAFEIQITSRVRVASAQNSVQVFFDGLAVVGPARITAYVQPDAVTASTIQADLDFYEV